MFSMRLYTVCYRMPIVLVIEIVFGFSTKADSPLIFRVEKDKNNSNNMNEVSNNRPTVLLQRLFSPFRVRFVLWFVISL